MHIVRVIHVHQNRRLVSTWQLMVLLQPCTVALPLRKLVFALGSPRPTFVVGLQSQFLVTRKLPGEWKNSHRGRSSQIKPRLTI